MLPDCEHVEEFWVVGDIRQLLLGGHGIGNDVVTGDEQLSARGRKIPASARSVVVLPAPLGPTSPMTSPALTSKLSPATATSSR